MDTFNVQSDGSITGKDYTDKITVTGNVDCKTTFNGAINYSVEKYTSSGIIIGGGEGEIDVGN